MIRLARAKVLDSADIAIPFVYNWYVRGCFLMGDNSITGKNFDHRKVWIEEYSQQFAADRASDQFDRGLPNQMS